MSLETIFDAIFVNDTKTLKEQAENKTFSDYERDQISKFLCETSQRLAGVQRKIRIPVTPRTHELLYELGMLKASDIGHTVRLISQCECESKLPHIWIVLRNTDCELLRTYCDEYGQTLIHLLFASTSPSECHTEFEEMAMFLISIGVNAMARTLGDEVRGSRSILFLAIAYNCTRLVELLLDLGASFEDAWTVDKGSSKSALGQNIGNFEFWVSEKYMTQFHMHEVCRFKVLLSLLIRKGYPFREEDRRSITKTMESIRDQVHPQSRLDLLPKIPVIEVLATDIIC